MDIQNQPQPTQTPKTWSELMPDLLEAYIYYIGQPISEENVKKSADILDELNKMAMAADSFNAIMKSN